MLTVTVKGTATHLLWDFGPSSPQVQASTVAGGLQTSVRFHPTTQNLTVKVTATGPGGSDTYTRKFTLPKPPTDPVSTAVQRALAAAHAPVVYGVGDASTLLGKTTCGFVTVYAGQQKVSGCLRPINALSDIPARELAAIQAMAHSLGLDPNDPNLMNAAVQQVDGYIGPGTVTLDGKWPAVPSPGASMVSFPGLGDLTSSSASLGVGGLKFGGLSGGFSLNVDPGEARHPAGQPAKAVPAGHRRLPDRRRLEHRPRLGRR